MTPTLEKINVLNTPVAYTSVDGFLQDVFNQFDSYRGEYVCVAASQNLVEAEIDAFHAETLNNAKVVLADGLPVALLQSTISGKPISQVRGFDIVEPLLKLSEQHHKRVFFFGGLQSTLDSVAERVARECPNLTVVGLVSPPMRDARGLSSDDIIQPIIDANPDVVVVVLGCPKQEQWMYLNHKKIPALMIGLGAAVPYYAGHVKEPPKIYRMLCLEWFFRMINDPKRLIMRYAIYNPLYIYYSLVQILKVKILRSQS